MLKYIESCTWTRLILVKYFDLKFDSRDLLLGIQKSLSVMAVCTGDRRWSFPASDCRCQVVPWGTVKCDRFWPVCIEHCRLCANTGQEPTCGHCSSQGSCIGHHWRSLHFILPCISQWQPFHVRYTGQPALVGMPEDFVRAKFYCLHAIVLLSATCTFCFGRRHLFSCAISILPLYLYIAQCTVTYTLTERDTVALAPFRLCDP